MINFRFLSQKTFFIRYSYLKFSPSKIKIKFFMFQKVLDSNLSNLFKIKIWNSNPSACNNSPSLRTSINIDQVVMIAKFQPSKPYSSNETISVLS